MACESEQAVVDGLLNQIDAMEQEKQQIEFQLMALYGQLYGAFMLLQICLNTPPGGPNPPGPMMPLMGSAKEFSNFVQEQRAARTSKALEQKD